MLFRDMGTSTGIKCDSLISSSLNTDIPHSLIFLKADFLVFLEPKKKKSGCVGNHGPSEMSDTMLSYLTGPTSNGRKAASWG